MSDMLIVNLLLLLRLTALSLEITFPPVDF